MEKEKEYQVMDHEESRTEKEEEEKFSSDSKENGRKNKSIHRKE
jgi:hypothetical protein